MSDRTPQLTLSDLKRECHRPGAAKLLLGVHKQLEMFSQYKANRKSISERS